MKILLLGKNGQLGASLYTQAKKENHTVWGFSREELDITDSQKIVTVLTEKMPDVVINASAYHVVPDCENFPQNAFAVNASSLKEIALFTKKNHITFVTISTDYVFDGLKGKPCTETDTPNPLQMYGISKYAGEIIARNYNPESIIVRTSAVYGGEKGSRSKKGNFVLSILKEMKQHETLEMSSEQIVSPTYADDLALGVLQLIKKNAKGGIYHLVNEGWCSWADFAKEIVKIRMGKMKVIPVDRSGGQGDLKRPLFSALENKKAKSLGIVLPKWQDGLSRYIQFLHVHNEC